MAKETLEQKAMRIAIEYNLDPQAVLQGMQMGDNDFIRAIAPYVNNPSDIDPSIARFHGMTEKQAPRGTQFDLKGFSVPEEYSSKNPYKLRTADGLMKVIPKEAGTVNVVNEGQATTWGHEYRHQLGQDGGSEWNNRYIDLIAAETPSDWKQALEALGNKEITTLLKQRDNNSNPKNAKKIEKRLASALTVYKEAIDKDTPESKANLKKHLEETKALSVLKNNFYNPNSTEDSKYPVSRRWKKFISEDWEKDKEKDSDKRKKANTAKTFWDAL